MAELIEKRNKEVVTFPYNTVVSDYTKQMILRMLAIEEADRITFEELFQSQLFNDINETPKRVSNTGILHQTFFNQLH